ncbi:MAG: hypothetical protein R3B48_18520 [Kofleriaceae bacterium]
MKRRHAPFRVAVALTVCLAVDAKAAPTPSASGASAPIPSAPTGMAKGEAEFLVAPGGGAFEIPIHALEVCVLTFPEIVSTSAIASSADVEVKAWDSKSLAVRANSKAKLTTLAVTTESGSVRINLTLRVVPANEDALKLVRFKAVTAEEAFQARLSAELAKRIAPIQAELESVKKNLDAQIRDRADTLIAERTLKRNEVVSLRAHTRNDAHVIAHVERALLFGDDAHLFFEIENRSKAPFRLLRATVLADGVPLSGPVRLRSTAVDKDPAVLGVVAAGASALGVVVVRNVNTVMRKSLTLELVTPDGHGTLRVTKGIVLR